MNMWNEQTFQMTCEHPPHKEHDSLTEVEELMSMLTLVGHQDFSEQTMGKIEVRL